MSSLPCAIWLGFCLQVLFYHKLGTEDGIYSISTIGKKMDDRFDSKIVTQSVTDRHARDVGSRGKSDGWEIVA